MPAKTLLLALRRRVIKGATEITCGEKKLLLMKNRPTQILLNKVQSGRNQSENDIVRFQDHFERIQI